MAKFVASEAFRGAEFVDTDMSEAVFREVDLSGARMYGVLLTGADIDGDISGLRVNGVEVAALIGAELDRLHPERTKLRPTTPEGAREAWAVVESFWRPTMERARSLSEDDRQRSVNEEWSLVATLRHLVFVIDSWFGRGVLGETHPFHRLGMPASFMTDVATFGIDTAAQASFEEVAAVRAERLAHLRAFLTTVTQDDLDRAPEPNPAPGWPPPLPRTAMSCLHVIFNEEWTHHQFALRDLAVIEASSQD